MLEKQGMHSTQLQQELHQIVFVCDTPASYSNNSLMTKFIDHSGISMISDHPKCLGPDSNSVMTENIFGPIKIMLMLIANRYKYLPTLFKKKSYIPHLYNIAVVSSVANLETEKVMLRSLKSVKYCCQSPTSVVLQFLIDFHLH